MTSDDLFEQLHTIDRAAASLLEAAGFYPNEGPSGTVCPPGDPAQDIFLRGLTESLLESLKWLREELAYLKSPVFGEYRLAPFPDGRYGFLDKNGKIHTLSCGNAIEAKIPDRYGRQRFTRCRIEHDGSDYYLWGPMGGIHSMEEGHLNIPLTGLTVREREVHHDF